jgi:glycosyltransferase involved in cell wall biosynthesis
MIHDTGGNIPIKCFESWSAGVPVVLSTISDTEIEQIFNECSAGKITNSFDPQDYADLIDKLLEENDRENSGKESHDFVLQNFDRLKQAQKLNEIIDELK